MPRCYRENAAPGNHTFTFLPQCTTADRGASTLAQRARLYTNEPRFRSAWCARVFGTRRTSRPSVDGRTTRSRRSISQPGSAHAVGRGAQIMAAMHLILLVEEP